MKRNILALLGAAAALGATADAATVWASDVDWQNNGTVGSANGRNNPANAIGAPGNDFLSLGLTTDGSLTDLSNPAFADADDVGFAVFQFNGGQTFSGGIATVFEVTFNCTQTGNGDCTYPESMAVYYGTDYDFGMHDLADVFDDFIFAGEVLNGDAQSGAQITIPGMFTYIALVDTTGLNYPNGPSSDGFDIGAVGVSEVPVPGAALLMGSGLLAAGLRRKKKA